jgi:hypothetical protein
MLITPKELEKIIELKKECWMSTDVEEKSLSKFIEMDWISPIQKDFTPKPSDWVIEIDLTDN